MLLEGQRYLLKISLTIKKSAYGNVKVGKDKLSKLSEVGSQTSVKLLMISIPFKEWRACQWLEVKLMKEVVAAIKNMVT